GYAPHNISNCGRISSYAFPKLAHQRFKERLSLLATPELDVRPHKEAKCRKHLLRIASRARERDRFEAVLQCALVVPARKADGSSNRPVLALEVVRRAALALGDERVGAREGLVPAAGF